MQFLDLITQLKSANIKWFSLKSDN